MQRTDDPERKLLGDPPHGPREEFLIRETRVVFESYEVRAAYLVLMARQDGAESLVLVLYAPATQSLLAAVNDVVAILYEGTTPPEVVIEDEADPLFDQLFERDCTPIFSGDY